MNEKITVSIVTYYTDSTTDLEKKIKVLENLLIAEEYRYCCLD